MGRAGSRTGRSKVRKRVGDSTRAASEGPRRGLHNRPGARPRRRGGGGGFCASRTRNRGNGALRLVTRPRLRTNRTVYDCDFVFFPLHHHAMEGHDRGLVAVPNASSGAFITRTRKLSSARSRFVARSLRARARKRRSSSSSADHSALCTNHSSPILIGGFPASTRPQCTMESSSGSVAPTIRYGIDEVTTTGASFVPLGALRNA